MENKPENKVETAQYQTSLERMKEYQSKLPKITPSHPFANIFPMFSEGETRELAEDIKRNGQRETIQIFEEKILDGRNRYLACQKAGVDPRCEEFTGTHQEALDYVLSRNAHRRHMDESQRAFAAAKLVKASTQICAITQQQAADILNVSLRSVSSAMCILTQGHQLLIDDVEQGRIPVSSAVRISYLDLFQQEAFFRLDTDTRKKAIKAMAELPKARDSEELDTLKTKVKNIIKQEEVCIELTKDEKEIINTTMILVGELDKSAFVKKVLLKQCLMIQKTSGAVAKIQERMKNSPNGSDTREAAKTIVECRLEDEEWLMQLVGIKERSFAPIPRQAQAN